MRASEHGFSLIEVLVAAGLFVVVAFAAFEAVRQLAGELPHLTARHLALEGLERLTARLRAEARGATAVWAGAAAGGGHDDCTELDFYAADASGPAFWGYRNFPNHTRSPGPGATPAPGADAVPGDAVLRVAGRAPLVPCAPADPGETVLLRTAGFALRRVDPAALAAHADPYLAGPDSAFVNAPAPDPRVPLGVSDAAGSPLAGGSTLTELRLDTADGSRVVDLVPGVFPGGFTALLTYACNARCQVGHDTGAPKTLTRCDVSWSTDPARYPQPVPAYVYDGATGGYVLAPRGYDWAVLFRFRYADPRPVPPGTGDTLDRYVVVDTFEGGVPAPAAPPFDRGAGIADAQAWYAALRPYVSAAMQQAFAAQNAICAGVNDQRTGPGYYDNG